MEVSLRTKLIGGFLIVNLLACVACVVLIVGLRNVSKEYQLVTDNVARADSLVTEAVGRMYEQASAIRGYALLQDRVYVDQFHDTSQKLNGVLGSLRDHVIFEEDVKTALLLRELNDSWREIGDRAVGLIGQGRTSDGLGVISTEGMVVTQDFLGAANALNAKYDQLAEEGVLQAARKARRSMITGICIALASVVFGVALGLYVASFVSQAVTDIQRRLHRLAEGDLTVQPLNVTSTDELGQMARSFNEMLQGLKQLVGDISESARSVSTAAEDLTAAAEQSAAAAGNAAGAVQQLANGAAGQAQSTEEVHTTMEQLHQTTQQIADGAQQTASEIQQSLDLLNQMAALIDEAAITTDDVKERANKATETARDGGTVVKRTIDGMNRIRAVVGESTDRITKLEELSLEIGNITETISGISDQTNLLALNAAIEAARAGENGRGFAVVAEEVRKLAERSDASAREIADLISTIQQRTSEAVQAMEVGNTEVASGSELAEEAGRALEAIAVIVEEAAQGMNRVSEATEQVRGNAERVVKAFDSVAAVTEENTAGSEEMAAAASEVARSMEEAAPAAQQNAAAAEELSSTIEELSASSEEVSASATDLSDVAERLIQHVSQFRLDDSLAPDTEEQARFELGRLAKDQLEKTAVHR